MESSPQSPDDETAYLAVLQLISNHGLAMAVKAVIELDIFNILARAGHEDQLSAAQIAGQIPDCDPSKAISRLDRVLRLLACHGILRCSFIAGGDVEGRYSLEPTFRLLTKDGDGVSLAPAFSATVDKTWLDRWQYLKDVVLEDTNPLIEVNDLMPSGYIAKGNHEYGKLFDQYTESFTKLISESIMHAYKGFESLSILVDAGGGGGEMLEMIISKYPHIKGINLDLPHVISSASSIPGVEHIAGDILVNIPNGDAILLKCILHDWNDNDCVRILKNCYKALPIMGKVIVVEQTLPEIVERSDAAHDVYFRDLCMMISSHQSKERSQKEFRAIACEAGFTEFKIACYVMNYHIMEFIK